MPEYIAAATDDDEDGTGSGATNCGLMCLMCVKGDLCDHVV